MTTELLRHRLVCLGWKVLMEHRWPDNGWRVWATSCCHTIIAVADSRHEAWKAACVMAMKLTWEEPLRLPFRPWLRFLPQPGLSRRRAYLDLCLLSQKSRIFPRRHPASLTPVCEVWQ